MGAGPPRAGPAPAFWHVLSVRLPIHAAAAAALLLLFFAAAPVSLEEVFPTYLAWYNSASLSLLSLLLLAWLRPPVRPTCSWISEGLVLAVLWLLKPPAAVVALAGLAVGLTLRRISLRHGLFTGGAGLATMLLLLPSSIPQAQLTDLATALHATSLAPNAGALSRLRLLLLVGGQNLFLLCLVGGISLLLTDRRARAAVLAMAGLLCLVATQNHGQWLAPWLLLAPLAAAQGPVLLLPAAMVAVGLGQQALLAVAPPTHTDAQSPRAWSSVPAAEAGPMAAMGGRLSLFPRDLDRATPIRSHPLEDRHAPDLDTSAGPLHALEDAWVLAQGERMLRAHVRPQDRVQTAGFANPWPWALGLPAVGGPLWMDPWRTVPLDRPPQDLLQATDLLMVPTSPRSRFHVRLLTPHIEAAACADGWRMLASVPGWRLLAQPGDARGQAPCPPSPQTDRP